MKLAVLILTLVAVSPAFAESRYPTPTSDGRQRIPRIGSCPTGYFSSGSFCEALRKDTPAAMPKIKGVSCPSGYFSSGDYCKALH